MNQRSSVEGKKLLLMGGIQQACEIITIARSMGVETFVTDYLEDSPAKKIADHSFMVDATDVDGLVNLCREQQIDGVFTGYVDMLLPYCQQVCQRLGLPFWGNAENINMCINKEQFKEACEASGVPVVPWKKANRENYQAVLETVSLPVVIKPADNSGSRGVYKCYVREELKAFAQKALELSRSGEILIEKLMDADSEFSLYYMIRDGRATLTAMGDRYVNTRHKEIAPIGQGMLYPSVHLQEWMETGDSLVKHFFEQNQMKDGFVFLQGFYENGFYLHEIGYRLNGGFTYRIVEHFSHYHQLKELITYSLTGTMSEDNEACDSPAFDGCGMIVTVSLRPGTIGKVSGVPEIEAHPNVLHFYQLLNEGEELNSFGTTAQNFAFILCASETREGMQETIAFIRAHLTVLDLDGGDMLNDIIDPNDIQF